MGLHRVNKREKNTLEISRNIGIKYRYNMLYIIITGVQRK
jgi:hypothetical protein